MSHQDVMISSTARDLPLHRKEVMDACLRVGMFPIMMDHLPPSDSEAIGKSLELVDQAEIYVGVFAHRYGYVPVEQNPSQISVTEMEYTRAVERKIPRLIFVMHEEHLLKAGDVELGAAAEKLAAFKSRIQTENIVNFFKSPEDLRAQVIHGLSELRPNEPVTRNYESDIPSPPEPYIAHLYTLLQTPTLIGRKKELKLLTDWVADPTSDVYRARILNFVAIGGTGKSAVTWHWFNNIAPQEMKPLAGRMWWSFYEPEATFENFITRALAYVSHRPLAKVQKIPTPDRESQLLAALKRETFLIVLDGFERLMIAYARADASRLDDAEIGAERNLRKAADPRVGKFLRKLAQTTVSRILVSSRLYPAELETDGHEPLPGCFSEKLEGLTDEDAVELWRAFEVSGARDELRPIFAAIDCHPLLIQVLAGEIKQFKRGPGQLTAWLKSNPHFNPTACHCLQDAMTHVLKYSLQYLEGRTRQVLQVIAAFRMPTVYPTLAAVLVGKKGPISEAIGAFRSRKDYLTLFDMLLARKKPCRTEMELDAVLVELEERGLVGWDRHNNRYDLHPIVRGIVWAELADGARLSVYARLHTHFAATPSIEDWEKVENLEELTPTIELYHTLIGMGRYDRACGLFRKGLAETTLVRLSANRQIVELLELLFPDGMDQLPRLRNRGDQGFTLNSLAVGYQESGQLGRAIPLVRRAIEIYTNTGDSINLSVCLFNLSVALYSTGALRHSEAVARRAIIVGRKRDDCIHEAICLALIGLYLAARGEAKASALALQRSLHISVEQSYPQMEGLVCAHLAERGIRFGENAKAIAFAHSAWKLARVNRLESDFTRAARVHGQAALGLGDLVTAETWINQALSRARVVNLVEEELPAIVALAKLRRRLGDENAARDLLDDVWEYAERGPYPLHHADALNVLAQLERDAGNTVAAIEAARKAYQLAWCDGPPYAYHWGLIKAEEQLHEMGAPLPEMPPFDESKFEPMPEIEIDPDDEFHAGAPRTTNRRPSSSVKTVVREMPKVGKNDPCPCGSGTKYKKCCGA